MELHPNHPNAARNREWREKKKAERAKLTGYQKLRLWADKLEKKNAVGVFVTPADITHWEEEAGNPLCACHGQLTFRRWPGGLLECYKHGTEVPHA